MSFSLFIFFHTSFISTVLSITDGIGPDTPPLETVVVVLAVPAAAVKDDDNEAVVVCADECNDDAEVDDDTEVDDPDDDDDVGMAFIDALIEFVSNDADI